MKRFTVICLLLILTLSAMGERSDAAAAAGFDKGALSIVPYEWPAVSADDVALDFPEAVWSVLGLEKPDDVRAYVEQSLGSLGSPYVMSLSPAGNSGIVEFARVGIAYYEGKYRIIYPSLDKGVEDVNGNLARFISSDPARLIGSEGVVYSPDGRYAVILNIDNALLRSYWIYDPIVIDLSTGEAVLTATYGNQIMKDEDAGCATAACFSRDGKTLYYTVYGMSKTTATGRGVSLFAYSLESGKTEFLCEWDGFAYYPRLIETASGSLALLLDSPRQNERLGFLEFRQTRSGWKTRQYTSALAGRYFYPTRMQYSEATGKALVWGRSGNTAVSLFQIIEPNRLFTGSARYYGISADGFQALELSMSKVMELPKAQPIGIGYLYTISMALSPNGEYMLALTFINAMPHLILIRLDDMTSLDLEGTENIQLKNFSRIQLEWDEDLIILRSGDKSELYTLK